MLARSTISLPEIGLGVTLNVDPDVPYIADCLRRGFLVPVGATEVPPPEAEVESTPAPVVGGPMVPETITREIADAALQLTADEPLELPPVAEFPPIAEEPIDDDLGD